MDEYEAVVYDLDGTLVRLDVDWDTVHAAVVERLDEHEVDVGDRNLWDILDVAAERGVKDVVEETIAAFEHEGAKASRRLPLADELPLGVPVAVCSLNCEAACRVALERHDLDRHVNVVVGRDTVARHKPNPEPLLYAIESVGAHPERTLFVGDSDSDREAAAAAGTAFEFVAARTAEAPPEGEN